jgi:hypothetical protein
MKNGLLLAMVTLLCSSCYHVYYSPNTPNTPLLSQRGEVKLIGAVGTGVNSEYTSGELQLAYAATNNFGLMLNGFMAAQSEETDDAFEKGKGSYAELAPGFFMPISPNAKWRAEVYAGVGTGTVTNDYGGFSNSKVGITKTFLQPALGFKLKHFEVAFTPKISFVSWKVKEDNVNEARDIYDKADIENIKSNPRFTAFEPSLIIRAGGRNVKGQLGITVSNLNKFYFESVENGLVSLGVSIGLNGPKKEGR